MAGKPLKISGYYLNNQAKSFDYTMNRIYDVLEEQQKPPKKNEYIAQIISGMITNSTDTESFFDVVLKQFNGVQSLEYKIRFIEQDEKFNRVEDPFDPKLTEQEKIQRIDFHDTAYFEKNNSNTIMPSNGCIVSVVKDNEIYKIRKVLYDGNPPSSYKPIASGRNAFSKNFNVDFLFKQGMLAGDKEKLKEREITLPDNIIQKLYSSFNQKIPEIKEKSVFFFGVRNLGKTNYNLFADTMIVAVKETDKFKFYSFNITTTPGKSFLGNLSYTKDGTLVLASPQYIKSAYAFTAHKGKYLALGQIGKFYYWRDKDRDSKADDSPATNVTLHSGTGNGVNIHRASADKKTKYISGPSGTSTSNAYKYEDGKWSSVTTSAYTYSAGCQVFSDPVDFNNFINLVSEDLSLNSKGGWDYFLIDSEDFATLAQGKLAKSSVEKKQKDKGITK